MPPCLGVQLTSQSTVICHWVPGLLVQGLSCVYPDVHNGALDLFHSLDWYYWLGCPRSLSTTSLPPTPPPPVTWWLRLLSPVLLYPPLHQPQWLASKTISTIATALVAACLAHQAQTNIFRPPRNSLNPSPRNSSPPNCEFSPDITSRHRQRTGSLQTSKAAPFPPMLSLLWRCGYWVLETSGGGSLSAAAHSRQSSGAECRSMANQPVPLEPPGQSSPIQHHKSSPGFLDRLLPLPVFLLPPIQSTCLVISKAKITNFSIRIPADLLLFLHHLPNSCLNWFPQFFLIIFKSCKVQSFCPTPGSAWLQFYYFQFLAASLLFSVSAASTLTFIHLTLYHLQSSVASIIFGFPNMRIHVFRVSFFAFNF